MALISAQLRLDDAFAGSIVVNEKTGERWVNLSKLSGAHIYQNTNKNTTSLTVMVSDKQTPDQYGNTHSLYLQQSKEDREAKAAKKYCGEGKVIAGGQPQQAAPQAATPAQASDDLPF